MPAQFVHLEAYALGGRGGKPSAIGVIDEAARKPKACRHIVRPQPPIVRYGCEPAEVETVLRRRIGEANGSKGRTVAITTLVFLTAVASWPISTESMQASPAEQGRYEDWQTRTIAFFRNLWGDALICAVEHTDEPFPHLHLLAVPPLAPGGVLTVETLSVPHGSQAAMRRAGGGRAEQRKAFRAAAIEFQDNYYEKVGAPCGLERIGPRRQRLSRPEILARCRAQDAEKRTAAAREADFMRRIAFARQEAADYRARCASEAARQINLDRERAAALGREAAETLRRVLADNEFLRQELDKLGWRYSDEQYG